MSAVQADSLEYKNPQLFTQESPESKQCFCDEQAEAEEETSSLNVAEDDDEKLEQLLKHSPLSLAIWHPSICSQKVVADPVPS